MTVGELIKKLSEYPDWIEVSMSMQITVSTKISSASGSIERPMFPKGRVYAVQGTIGSINEIIISGS
jgi:hypothetical protein